ncbi:MAG: hypothetical protein IH988_10270 [Planctomycetes bacterium]|nr:hypothetical protein [Planctomycetota bacterium]
MSRWRRPAFYLAAMAALSIGLGLGVACKKESKHSGRGSRERQAQSQKNKDGGARRGGANTARSRNRGGRRESAKKAVSYPPLESIQLVVPKGWHRYPVKEPTGGLRASYRLPGALTDPGDVLVLLEYVPGIRRHEQAMLIKWFGKELALTHSVPTAEAMKVREVPLGKMTVTIAEMSGKRRRAGGSRTEDSPVRHMVVIAILDHPDGPHVVRASGPAESFLKQYKSILTYIQSARIVP